jgi:ABC-type phosphate transport system substrate-binding protein
MGEKNMKLVAGITALAFVLMAWNAAPSVAQAGNSDYIIVANKQMAGSSINTKALKGIYLREVKSWGNGGGQIIVVNMEGSGDFYENLFGKTYVQMQAYWLNMRIKYSVDLPITKKDSAQVKQFVASQEGAIGFIKAGELDDTVKALKVTN